MIHRGEILEKYIRKSKVNLTKLADALPWTVKTIYRDFKEEDLALEKLLEYSRALKYDFKEEFPELQALRKSFREPHPAYKPVPGEEEEEEEESEGDYYRRKYEECLEKYNTMLERYNDLLQNRLNSMHLDSRVQG